MLGWLDLVAIRFLLYELIGTTQWPCAADAMQRDIGFVISLVALTIESFTLQGHTRASPRALKGELLVTVSLLRGLLTRPMGHKIVFVGVARTWQAWQTTLI